MSPHVSSADRFRLSHVLTRSSKYFPVAAIMLLLRKTTCLAANPYQRLADRPSKEFCYSDCCAISNKDYRASLPANRAAAFEVYLGKSRRHEPRALREDQISILCRCISRAHQVNRSSPNSGALNTKLPHDSSCSKYCWAYIAARSLVS